MAYKILNGQVILPPDLLPKITHTRTPRTCNQAKVGLLNELYEPHATLHNTAESFFYLVPKLWNSTVSPEQAVSPSVDSFKGHFSKNI